MLQKFKFSYDKENDDLFLYNQGAKSRGSVEFGDLIFDYNTKKELVGVQIINASKYIKEFTGKSLADIKRVLGNLSNCKLELKKQNKFIFVKLFLSSRTEEVNPVIPLPKIESRSPALAYA